MNCLEFRRQLLIDAHHHDAEFLRHRRCCRECQREIKRIDQLDEQLRLAAQIALPEGMTSRILLNQSFEPQAHTLRWLWFVLAGGGLLMTLLGLLSYWW